MNLNAESLNKSDISPAVARQAVSWMIEMQEGGLDSRRQHAWQQWLNGNSEHQRAWAHIQRVNQRLSGLSSPLAHAALNAPSSSGRRQALKLLLLLGAGSAAGWGLRDQIALQPLLADLRSGVGEQRKETLSDGTQVQLNTASALDVRFDAGQRFIKLLQGEILMTAVADSRPLNLLTAQGTVHASTAASRFNLRQLDGRTQLAVLDGSLEISPDAHVGPPLRLQARQQVTFSRDAWDPVRPTDASTGAWAEGMLVASHMKLTDFLAELGRYRRGRLNCDAKVANLLISGSYPLADSERILDMLEVTLPVRVQRFTRYWVSVQARV
ncbi:FecR family protein [Pseudomonas cichorii]|uniref:FecR domain-containing protein n=1 Tax=Pseudomonas cichorii TaxID=36746 RepID=UPI00190FCB36|nr:FecR family protein [Pseudomonas cichorii]MBX8492739.1 FecR family protein [Pseudomonas cichorii]MBX8511879.1 FecR family protein [Pseudomonas cichorii]MBX8526629.1 FecR family protein [Pseudomonas cichorii]MBX8546819.1 FecR family protein [Pseudomonas cichorii]MBX8567661.1 FecR family protein [Pseudomonas cichorii]